MARIPINYGTTAGDRTGDVLFDSFKNTNDNFIDLYLSNLDNVITIRQASDFGTIASDKYYYIPSFVDMGDNSINIPEGVKLNIVGYNYSLSGLYSTEDNYTMFIGDANGVSDISFARLDLKTSGTNSQLFDISGYTGFEVISFEQVNFSDCSSLGEIDNFRQGEEYGTGRFGGSPTLTLTGIWLGGYLIERSLTRFLDDTSTEPLFKSGTGLVFNSRFDSNMNLDLGTNGSYLDFAPANFANSDLLQLHNGIVTRDGAYDTLDANITPNITEKDSVSKWWGNTGLPNTDKGGLMTITSETATVLTQDIWTDLAGTFTLSKEQHTDSPSNGEIRNIGNTPIDYKLISVFSIDGTANNELEMRAVIFRDDTSTDEPQDVFAEAIDSNVGGNDLGKFIMFDSFQLRPDDKLRYQIRNTTSNANITAKQDRSKFRLEER